MLFELQIDTTGAETIPEPMELVVIADNTVVLVAIDCDAAAVACISTFCRC